MRMALRGLSKLRDMGNGFVSTGIDRLARGPEGIRTPDLLNAMLTVDGPPGSTGVVFEFRRDSKYRRLVRQSPPKSTR